MDEGTRRELDERGFALVPGAVAAAKVEALRARAAEAAKNPGARQRHGATYAVRGMLWNSDLARTLEEIGVTELTSRALGKRAFPIDAMLFDKIPESNWKVPGHQDLVVPFADAPSDPEFLNASSHDGVPYAQPPVAVLRRLVAARIHLDDTSAENGALAVVPGTHRKKLDQKELGELPPSAYVVCEAREGDVLFMRPLLVHRSAPAMKALHRRVLHVVYACEEPAKTVRWRSGART